MRLVLARGASRNTVDPRTRAVGPCRKEGGIASSSSSWADVCGLGEESARKLTGKEKGKKGKKSL